MDVSLDRGIVLEVSGVESIFWVSTGLAQKFEQQIYGRFNEKAAAAGLGVCRTRQPPPIADHLFCY